MYLCGCICLLHQLPYVILLFLAIFDPIKPFIQDTSPFHSEMISLESGSDDTIGLELLLLKITTFFDYVASVTQWDFDSRHSSCLTSAEEVMKPFII